MREAQEESSSRRLGEIGMGIGIGVEGEEEEFQIDA